ncbi:50S ribosomal protein L10 [bacterium]|nr:50S ribosomal protein L10 [bacterium]
MSKTAIQTKISLVQHFVDEFKKAKSFIVFEYLGLTAKSITNLRFELNKNQAKMFVLKNNILKRAIDSLQIQGFEQLMQGPNAIVIGYNDEIVPIKAVSELAKEFDVLKIKGAYLDNQFIDASKIKEIASIPGREGLYSMLLSCLQSPIRSFLYAIKAVGDSKN